MRRGLVTALACVLAAAAMGAAVVSSAQWREQKRQITVGIIQFSSVDDQTAAGFKAGLSEAGFREGVSVTYEHGGPAGSKERLSTLVNQAVERNVDLIMVSSTPAARAVVDATRSHPVPVIFAPVNDPLGAGIVPDLAHPGGHVTGVRLPLGDDLRLQWLKRIVPKARTVLTPYVPTDKSSLNTVAAISASAPALGLDIKLAPVSSCVDVQAALQQNAGVAHAVFLPRDSLVEACIDGIVATARQLRIPVAAPSVTQVRRGALFSYGFVHEQIGRQAARLAVQVLRGVSPGDLPVETAENHLAVNPKAAAAIGLALADDVLVQADIVERD